MGSRYQFIQIMATSLWVSVLKTSCWKKVLFTTERLLYDRSRRVKLSQNWSIFKRIRIGWDWKEELDKFLVMYRNTPHTTTDVSPSQLLIGRKLRTKPPKLFEPVSMSSDICSEIVGVQSRPVRNKKQPSRFEGFSMY